MESKQFKTVLKYGSLEYKYNLSKDKFVYLFTPYDYYTCNFSEINNTSLDIVINEVIKVIDFIEKNRMTNKLPINKRIR